MSYYKAVDLLRLAELANSRHLGVGLSEIEETFEVDRRTAQRMTKALEAVFPHVETSTDVERRKYWKLTGDDLRLVASQGIRDAELAALEMSIRRAERDGSVNEAESLRRLRDRLLALMPGPHKRRAEADAEALLEAQGFASRPGPRVVSNMKLLGVLTEATIRLLPAPRCERVLVCPHADLDGAFRFVRALRSTQLLPAALEVISPAAGRLADEEALGIVGPGGHTVVIAFEGEESAVERQVRDTLAFLGADTGIVLAVERPIGTLWAVLGRLREAGRRAG